MNNNKHEVIDHRKRRKNCPRPDYILFFVYSRKTYFGRILVIVKLMAKNTAT